MGREELLSQRLEVIDPTVPPPVWAALRNEAERAAMSEPALASLLNAVVLSHENLGEALSHPDTHLRLFGKPRVAGQRRVAVTLALGADVEDARERARQSAAALAIDLK